MTLLPVAWADYFGRESYGAIRGVALSLQVLAQAAGPLLSGALRDWSGNYTESLMVFGVLAGGWRPRGGACTQRRVRSRRLLAARKRLRPLDKKKTAAARRGNRLRIRDNTAGRCLRRAGMHLREARSLASKQGHGETACRHCWR